MTDKERKDEGAEEAIEDLEAPAEQQDDVAGGAEICASPTVICVQPSCIDTVTKCIRLSLQKEQHFRG
jgi:hypothetical protein